MKQDKLIHKILRISLWVFMAIGLITLVYLMLSPNFKPPEGSDEMKTLQSRTGIILTYGVILLLIGAAIAVIFPIIFMILNPKNAIKVLIVVVIFVVLGGISYLFASGSIDGAVYEKFEVTASSSRMIGGALVLTYILAGLTVASIIFSSISKMLK